MILCFKQLPMGPGLPENCHWPVNDIFYRSTASCLKQRIMHVYGHPLMAICHWPPSMTKTYGQNFKNCLWHLSMTKKLSLTMVNDKKNCHWLKVIYIGIFICVSLEGTAGQSASQTQHQTFDDYEWCCGSKIQYVHLRLNEFTYTRNWLKIDLQSANQT